MSTKQWISDSSMDEPYRRCQLQYKMPRSEVEWVMRMMDWGRERSLNAMLGLIRANGVGHADYQWYIQQSEDGPASLCYGIPREGTTRSRSTKFSDPIVSAS